MRPLALLITVVLVAAVPTSAAPGVDALIKHIPDDAGLALVVPNFETALAGMRSFVQAIGDPDNASQELTTEAVLKNAPGGPAAWNPAAPFVLAVMPEYDAAVMLVPTPDMGAWRSAVQPRETEDGLLAFDHDGAEVFVATRENILCMSDNQRAVRAAVNATGKFAIRYHDHAEALARAHHAVVYIDIPSWKVMLDQNLQMGEMMMQMAASMAGNAPATAVTMNFLFERLRELMGDVDANAIGVSIGADGLRLHNALFLRPESKLSQYMAGLGRPQTDILRGLPDIDSGVVFGYEWKIPPKTDSFFEQLFTQLEATIDSAALDDPAATRRALRVLRDAMALDGASVAMIDGGEKGLGWLGVYLTDEPDRIITAMRSFQNTAVMEAYMDLWMPGVTMEVHSSQQQLAGTDVDIFRADMKTDDPELSKAFTALYGTDMTTVLARTPEGVHYAVGRENTARDLAELALSGERGALSKSPAVQAALRDLPPHPQILILIDPARLVQFGLATATAVGMPPPPAALKLGDVRYASVAMYLDEAAITTELRLPADTVKPVMDYFAELNRAARKQAERSAADSEAANE